MEFIRDFVTFLNNNEGALMVIITFVYVIATCAICWANISSAKASKAQLKASNEQLEEAKREHEENIRIGIMPFLQFEAYPNSDYNFELDFPLFHHDSCDRICAEIMRLTNIGNGAATNIVYTWENKEFGIFLSEAFRVNAIKADGDYKISLVFDGYSKVVDPTKRYILTLQYDDMRGYTYEQRMIFSFCYDGESISIAEVDTDAPKYTGVKFIG